MKKIAEAWSSLSLIKRIIIGLVIGALLGAFGPKDLAVIEMLGTLFVSALKAVAPFLVFFLVTCCVTLCARTGTGSSGCVVTGS